MALLARVKEFSELIASDSTATSQKKREAFARYAALFNEADELVDTDALAALVEARPAMALPRRKSGALDTVSQVFRFLVTLVVALGGCVVLAFLAPLRCLHPPLRAVGVPHGLLPHDMCQKLWNLAILSAVGIKVVVEADASVWKADSAGLIVYNHASMLDPFIVSVACQGLAPKYVGKKSLFKVPIFGWAFMLVGMIPINRGDREKAVAALNDAVGLVMKARGRSVALSPEGTRTTDGHLVLPFKKGAFHMQAQTGAPFLPVAISGAFELWPPHTFFSATGEVTVTRLPEQSLQHGEEGADERTAARISLQKSFVKALSVRSQAAKPLALSARLEHAATLSVTFLVYWMCFRLMASLCHDVGLGVGGVGALLVVFSLLNAVLVDKCM
eukprot:TRINITY_DN42790_c0_g1_i1.p1 TRINITY_DN42790_c0_g1~~TRINITY_DN42790_c0_g1_i1.p1  ORF type:complete len:411 (+),score=46.15 TRINITY_DN42790_c0_g1_i1:69-1235(+)